MLCSFKFMSDKDRILKAGPWFVKGCLVVLKEWSPELGFHEIDFSTFLIWVQVHNLPRDQMNLENASKIGNFIGRFLHWSHNTGKFLRIRVDIKISKALKTSFFTQR